ncbi:hypothetical protein MTO96_009329 [Rhipicephalus appendiculatus]
MQEPRGAAPSSFLESSDESPWRSLQQPGRRWRVRSAIPGNTVHHISSQRRAQQSCGGVKVGAHAAPIRSNRVCGCEPPSCEEAGGTPEVCNVNGAVHGFHGMR